MHRLFPDWHEGVVTDITLVPLDARWAGVEEVVSDPSSDLLILVAKIAHERPMDPTQTEQFREIFRKHDKTFPMRGQERLIAMLASASMVVLRENGNRQAALSTHLSLAANNVGWEPLLADVKVDSRELLHLASQQRQVPPWSAKKVAFASTAYKQALTRLKSSGAELDAESLIPILEAIAQSVTDAIQRTLHEVQRNFNSRERPLREELDVLRWLLSGHSGLTGECWSSYAARDIAILAAIELQKLTDLPICLPDFAALLAQTIDQAATPTSADAPTTWQLNSAIAETASATIFVPKKIEELTPLAVALEAGSLSDKKLPDEDPLTTSIRLYEELQLLAAYSESEEP
ncbi:MULTISPECIES: GTPase-associated system all-helical protein GASH [unclassified Micromonospora]|uniref:GTPase-associated system all-helical protein GASH n=1 Tax=unclassified Micromonospora TaxID=2617518 RepID=UPI003627C8B3